MQLMRFIVSILAGLVLGQQTLTSLAQAQAQVQTQVTVPAPAPQQQSQYETPPLVLRSYESLGFSGLLSKDEVRWMLQTTIDKLDQHAFVDFGDHSDFMHLHLILRPKYDLLKPAREMIDPGWTPPWNQLTKLAALIYTQEYPGARASRPYLARDGHVIAASDRNQLLFLSDSEFGTRGEIIDAHALLREGRKKDKKTVNSIDLDPRFVGEDPGPWEYSFYFYRVQCSGPDRFVAEGGNLEQSTVLELAVGGERACVNLLNFVCRKYPHKTEYCAPGIELTPYYNKTGVAD